METEPEGGGKGELWKEDEGAGGRGGWMRPMDLAREFMTASRRLKSDIEPVVEFER
jgi:hypothetical protein